MTPTAAWSSRARVLELLTAKRGEWVSGLEVREVGGPEATRRVRELREDGFKIDVEGHGEEARYRLREVPRKYQPYRRYACPACGFAGPEPVMTHTLFGVLCSKCGAPVEEVAGGGRPGVPSGGEGLRGEGGGAADAGGAVRGVGGKE